MAGERDDLDSMLDEVRCELSDAEKEIAALKSDLSKEVAEEARELDDSTLARNVVLRAQVKTLRKINSELLAERLVLHQRVEDLERDGFRPDGANQHEMKKPQ